jgi:hypothetical protein
VCSLETLYPLGCARQLTRKSNPNPSILYKGMVFVITLSISKASMRVNTKNTFSNKNYRPWNQKKCKINEMQGNS